MARIQFDIDVGAGVLDANHRVRDRLDDSLLARYRVFAKAGDDQFAALFRLDKTVWFALTEFLTSNTQCVAEHIVEYELAAVVRSSARWGVSVIKGTPVLERREDA